MEGFLQKKTVAFQGFHSIHIENSRQRLVKARFSPDYTLCSRQKTVAQYVFCNVYNQGQLPTSKDV